MEVAGVILLVVFVFCLGWLTGNIVEWVMTYRERRLIEKEMADRAKELWRRDILTELVRPIEMGDDRE